MKKSYFYVLVREFQFYAREIGLKRLVLYPCVVKKKIMYHLKNKILTNWAVFECEYSLHQKHQIYE